MQPGYDLNERFILLMIGCRYTCYVYILNARRDGLLLTIPAGYFTINIEGFHHGIHLSDISATKSSANLNLVSEKSYKEC